jgi:hypothetical protein
VYWFGTKAVVLVVVLNMLKVTRELESSGSSRDALNLMVSKVFLFFLFFFFLFSREREGARISNEVR